MIFSHNAFMIKMRDSDIQKVLKILKKAINVPLMDIPNISYLILDYVVDVRKHYMVTFDKDIDFIFAIVLAINEEEAFSLLKLKLDTIEVKDFSNFSYQYRYIDYSLFQIQPLYSYNKQILNVSRIDYLVIRQDYFHDPLGLEYTFYEYKFKCKPQKQWVKIYDCRRDYYGAHTYYPDHRIESEYTDFNVETAQSSIQYLF